MRKHLVPLIFLFIFSLFSLRSLFTPGFMYTHDGLWHVQRITHMVTELKTSFPVRWVGDLDNGYGLPLFNFAYPAPYYGGALLTMLGLGPVKSFYALIFLAYFAGGVGVYLLARHRFYGLVAALLYLLTPYQFLDIFVRGALGEVVALGLFPWIILALKQISQTGKLAWFSPIPFALLLLSHNFFAYLFSGLLLFWILAVARHKLVVILSLVISLALSAFFTLPALFEKQYLLISQSDSLGYRDHFVYPSQLLARTWEYVGSLQGIDPGEMSYQLGLATFALIVLSIYAVIKYKSRMLNDYLLLLAFAIYLMLPSSDWLWQIIPLLSSIQFPWRLLGLVSFIVVLIYLELIKHLPSKPLSILLVVIALVTTLGYARPLKWLDQDQFMALHYEYAGGTTTAHRDELVPRWAQQARHLSGPVLVLSSGSELRSTLQQAHSLTFTATSPDDHGSAIYHANYYPMWELLVDDRAAPLTPTSSGSITFPLQRGDHTYTIRLGSTFLQKLGNAISILSLALLFYVATRPPRPVQPPLSSKPHTSKRGK